MKLFFFGIILIFFFESLYCFMRKKKSVNRKGLNIDEQKKNSILMSCVTFANDVTFILFKVIGYIPAHFIRKFFYKYIFHLELGKNVVIYYGFEARSPWNIKIGNNTIIGDHAIFDARYGIHIGENVNISSGAWVWTLQHDVNSPCFGTEGQEGAVEIKDRAWVSSRTTLLPKTIVEEGVVIAAGAVVTGIKTVPYGIYGGIPAGLISMRNRDLNYVFDGKHRRFI